MLCPLFVFKKHFISVFTLIKSINDDKIWNKKAEDTKTKSCFSLRHKVSSDEARTAKGRPTGAGRRPDHIKHHRRRLKMKRS